MENAQLVVSPLEAKDKPEYFQILESLISDRLPQIELTDLLVEVDHWTGFSSAFEHAGGSRSRSRDLLRH